MRTHIALMILGLGLAIVLSATPAQAQEDLRATIRDEIAKAQKDTDDNTFKVYWKDGVRMDTGNKDIKLKLGGRIMLDHWWIDDSNFENIGRLNVTPDMYTDFRRVRLYWAGEMYKHLEFKLQVDFQNPNAPVANDFYIGIKNLRDCIDCGAPNIRVGHFKVPFGLEQLTSSKYITFMERSAAINAFTPSRRYQVMFHERFRGDRLGVQGSAFLWERTGPVANDGGAELSDGWGLAGRITYAPWWVCDCPSKRVHVGLSVLYADDIDNRTTGAGGNQRSRFRARAGHGQFNRLADSGRLAIDKLFMLGFEAAWVTGPLSIQGEVILNAVDGISGTTPNPTFLGWYAQASYWLTGEHRSYKKGVFSRVKPCCNFLSNDCDCLGGWEVAVRYEGLDMNENGINGGDLNVLTLGVNWHLNPNARIMFNFIYADVTGGPGNLAAAPGPTTSTSMTGFGMRWQVDF